MSQLTQELRLGIDEGDRGPSDLLVGSTVNGVVDQGLGVGCDPNGNGAVDTGRNDTLRKGEGDG